MNDFHYTFDFYAVQELSTLDPCDINNAFFVVQ